MNCPHCHAYLSDVTYEGVSIHTCNGCGGEFIGPKELSCIVNKRETVFGQHLKKLVEHHKPIFGKLDEEIDHDMKCPGCKHNMKPMNYAGDTAVCVDRCDKCGGMWLDHEELEKIQLITEHWQDRAPSQLKTIAGKLEQSRIEAAEKTSKVFRGSRFSFVNALINRLLEAA